MTRYASSPCHLSASSAPTTDLGLLMWTIKNRASIRMASPASYWRTIIAAIPSAFSEGSDVSLECLSMPC